MGGSQVTRLVMASVVVALMSFSMVSAAAAQVPSRVRVGGDIKEPKKIKHVAPVYPEDARAAGIQGIVILEAVIGTDGGVADARVLRPVAGLDRAALDAVLQWTYTPTLLNGEPVELLMTVTVTFTLGAPDSPTASEFGLYARIGTPQSDFAATVDQAKVYRDARRFADAEQMLERALAQIRQERVDTTTIRPITMTAGPPDRRVLIGGDTPEPRKIRDVAPVYPEAARAAGLEGVSILEITIGTDGRVTGARVLRSITIFDQAALEAVRQWQYTPVLLNGTPVPAVMTVTVAFKKA